jgi:hypothetical protein
VDTDARDYLTEPRFFHPSPLRPGRFRAAMNDLRHQVLASLQAEDVAALSDNAVEALAKRLQPYLSQAGSTAEPDGWLNFNGALAYLSMEKGSLYKLTAAQQIPFHQDGPGCKLWFLRSELDEWRRIGGSRSVRSRHLKAA